MIRQRARQENEKCMNRLILKASGSTPASVYCVSEDSLVKIKDTNHRVNKKYTVMPGTIVKRNLALSKYKTQKENFSSVEHTYKKTFLIAYTHKDHVKSFMSSGMTVKLDPLPDGNYQFAAMADQLADLGIFRSPGTLREEIE